ncbi:MAG: hypothetical protein ACJAZF_005094, partial [Granulosicoccus sp.]
ESTVMSRIYVNYKYNFRLNLILQGHALHISGLEMVSDLIPLLTILILRNPVSKQY